MKIRELLARWEAAQAPQNTAETYEMRLDAEDAAKLHALAEMYPGVSVEDILQDLLTAALDELEAVMPYQAGPKVIAEDDHGDPVYEDAGPTPRFIELTRKHKARLAPD
ncbi:MAG: type 1 pili tip component [Gammaproteobacteria bacterium]